jgi:hypothetical protein
MPQTLQPMGAMRASCAHRRQLVSVRTFPRNREVNSMPVVLCKPWILLIHRLHSATATDDKNETNGRGDEVGCNAQWLEGLLTKPPSRGYPPKFPKRRFFYRKRNLLRQHR